MPHFHCSSFKVSLALCLLAMPLLASGKPPVTGVPVAIMPQQTGADFLGPLNPSFTVTGAVLINPGLLIETNPFNGSVTVGEFNITTNFSGGFTFISQAFGGSFPDPWSVTPIPNGVRLDAPAGGPFIGQPVAVGNADLFGYQVTSNPGLTGSDLTAFRNSTFTFSITPEPGPLALCGSSLLAGAGLVWRRARQRRG